MERDGKLFGYEMKWGAAQAKPPKEWLAAYPSATWQLFFYLLPVFSANAINSVFNVTQLCIIQSIKCRSSCHVHCV